MHGKRNRIVPFLALLVGFAALVPTTVGAASKPTLQFPDDFFIHDGGSGGPSWAKFLILVSDPDTVYFQESNSLPFHYDFATGELAPFLGMSPEEFDSVTLFATNQQAILGAVLIPPAVNFVHFTPEYGIQLVRRDPYSAVETRDILQTVRSKVISEPGVQPYYMPTFEQQATAQANAAFLESEGFPVSSASRWGDGNACYSVGWALGRLVFVPATQIDAAFVGGQLTSDDILLTDGVPAEIPFVAGVISLGPSTPNSHVALLSQTFNVPFTHLALEADAQKAQALVGRRVALRVRELYGACQVRIVDTDDELDQATADEILLLKTPPELEISPMEVFGAYSSSTNGLVPSDIRYFGGKAANSGILRQSIPASSPVSTAFSFDLWNEFMDQQLTGGNTLRQEIAQRLAPFGYPPDIAALDGVLDGIRELIKDDTVFSPTLSSAVLTTLQDAQYGFDPNRKLRFRSSTNVEDSERFTGAGLYDSFSGCLADDLDADSAGPSVCDPAESNERGTFRAIRKVFASFYNLNACLERLRHGIDETQVGMALLVHHSFPDEIELANGVGSYAPAGGTSKHVYLVLQPGASSVTNPEPGQVAEEVDVYIYNFINFIDVTVVQESNLLLLGQTVLDLPDEYRTLTELLDVAAAQFETTTGIADLVLEFEFKKTAPGGDLVVTQVRRVPQPDETPSITPFLINEPGEYCVFQGEAGGSVFASHRLKSRWTLETRSLWLSAANLQAGFLDEASLEYIEGCMWFTRQGPIPGWPGFSHAYVAGQTDDSWSFDDLQNPRAYTVQAPQVPELVAPSQSPILLLTDFGLFSYEKDTSCLPLRVDYSDALPDQDYTGPISTTTDRPYICRCPQEEITDLLVNRVMTDAGVTIDTSYYWPRPPGGVVAGYTAPTKRFLQTTITGLTSQPIVLTGEYSQTHKPGHHNFSDEYLFEPALEPGISPEILDALAAWEDPADPGNPGVRVIYVDDNGFAAEMTFYNNDEWGYHCLACRGPDADDDERCLNEPTFDCDDTNPDAWATPAEVPSLWFETAGQVQWSPPQDPGARLESIVYDTLRATGAPSFLDAVCLETDGIDTSSMTASTPSPGSPLFYLVRAENDCPAGSGTLGSGSAGAERAGASCP